MKSFFSSVSPSQAKSLRPSRRTQSFSAGPSTLEPEGVRYSRSERSPNRSSRPRSKSPGVRFEDPRPGPVNQQYSSRRPSFSERAPTEVHVHHVHSKSAPNTPRHRTTSLRSNGPPVPQVVYVDSRPATKRTYSSSSSEYSVMSSSVVIHRTLAYRNSHPALRYNTLNPPNHTNVIGASNGTPISAHSLNLPATSPPTTHMTLRAAELPWPIVITSSTSPRHAITILDVLESIHAALRVLVRREEWESFGKGSRTQYKVADAYKRRCMKHGGDWENGIRRVDLLDGRTFMVGIEAGFSGDGSHNLIMSK